MEHNGLPGVICQAPTIKTQDATLEGHKLNFSLHFGNKRSKNQVACCNPYQITLFGKDCNDNLTLEVDFTSFKRKILSGIL